MNPALVDGDPIVYITGFAAEESVYETPDGLIHPTPGKAKKHCDLIGCDPNEINRMVEAEPKSHVLHLVKNLLERVEDVTQADDMRIFLSGGSNFRDSVATILPYKGNRPDRKPVHYDNIRKYMISQWGAEIIEGMEADDALAINQTSESVICTIDKDLDMVEGWHYNYSTEKLYEVSPFGACYSFYRQLLTGDSTDNIQGLVGVGKKTADKWLADCKTEEDMFWVAMHAYAHQGTYERPYEALVENARLLWMLREEGEIWKPKW